MEWKGMCASGWVISANSTNSALCWKVRRRSLKWGWRTLLLLSRWTDLQHWRLFEHAHIGRTARGTLWVIFFCYEHLAKLLIFSCLLLWSLLQQLKTSETLVESGACFPLNADTSAAAAVAMPTLWALTQLQITFLTLYSFVFCAYVVRFCSVWL